MTLDTINTTIPYGPTIQIGSRKTPMTAKTGGTGIRPGKMVTKSAAGTVIEAAAAWGKNSQQNTLYVCEAVQYTAYLNGNDVHEYDSTGALTPQEYASGDPIPVLELKPGDKVWALTTNLAVTEDESLITAANGFLTTVGDPDGEVVAVMACMFKALATITAGGANVEKWIPVEYLGKMPYDATP